MYCEPIPYVENAARYYAAISDLPWPAWLDSGGLGRYDILCARPDTTLTTHGEKTLITHTSGIRYALEDPIDLLRAELGSAAASQSNIPFAGGALGYWAYSLAGHPAMGAIASNKPAFLPDMAIGIYDWALVIDHQDKTAWLASHLRNPATAGFLPKIQSRIASGRTQAIRRFAVQGPITSNFDKAAYLSAVGAVKEYLYSGDCYQVNLSQQFTVKATGDPLQAYEALRQTSPAPYSALLSQPHATLLSVSPEQFLSVKGGAVVTRPIKGTRRRAGDSGQDSRQAQELEQSAKDRAENLMIVDLMRNDLGKECIPGSIRVPALFELESFAQVHHLVSTITGMLAPGRDSLSLLRSCLPGGSVTGAPKRRAMEIIEQLEPHKRDVYCGAIGYIGFDGNMDSNIAIRTLVYAGGEIRFWAGGGIVADSEGEAEYQETLDKAGGMMEMLRRLGAQAGA